VIDLRFMDHRELLARVTDGDAAKPEIGAHHVEIIAGVAGDDHLVHPEFPSEVVNRTTLAGPVGKQIEKLAGRVDHLGLEAEIGETVPDLGEAGVGVLLEEVGRLEGRLPLGVLDACTG
jgi:hypothetical protein